MRTGISYHLQGLGGLHTFQLRSRIYIHLNTASYDPLPSHGSCIPPLCLLSGFLCHCGCASLWRGHALTAKVKTLDRRNLMGSSPLRNGGIYTVLSSETGGFHHQEWCFLPDSSTSMKMIRFFTDQSLLRANLDHQQLLMAYLLIMYYHGVAFDRVGCIAVMIY